MTPQPAHGSSGSHDHTERLEMQVRLLSAALGLSPEEFAAVVPEVLALATAGEQVKAIRLLRKRTGLGLLAAKRVTDALSSATPRSRSPS